MGLTGSPRCDAPAVLSNGNLLLIEVEGLDALEVGREARYRRRRGGNVPEPDRSARNATESRVVRRPRVAGDQAGAQAGGQQPVRELADDPLAAAVHLGPEGGQQEGDGQKR